MSALEVDVAVTRQPERGPAFRLEACLEAREGMTVVCGPSGSGKSSLLMAVLGALTPERGRVRLGPATLFDSERGIRVPIHRRRIGMVLQEAPLFPHLDVAGNVAFGMHGRRDDRRVARLLERVGAENLAGRRTDELSGGQKQRIALARALAASPSALLLDEPFSALDAPARVALGRLLLELQANAGIPFVHVTHDLAEAVRLGSRLVLLSAGRVIQSGTPSSVICRPTSPETRRAVGTTNLFAATVLAHDTASGCSSIDVDGTELQLNLVDAQPGERIPVGVSAEDILVSLEPLRLTSARNVLPATLVEIVREENVVELRVTTPAPFRVRITPAAATQLGLKQGQSIYLVIKASAFHTYGVRLR